MDSNLKSRSMQTAGIILAAGMSNRMGQPKQLLLFKKKYLLEYVLDTALSSRLDAVILVLGHQDRRISIALAKKLSNARIEVVVNPRFKEGLSRSLCMGLETAKSYSSVMFLLGDQPLVNSRLIDLLLERFHASDKAICVPVHRGKRGNPVLFNRRFYEILMGLKGDIGAREVIASHPDQVLEVEVDDPGVFTDIDTLADFEALTGATL